MIDDTRRDGASQTDRDPAALRPGYFQLDEMAFGQLLAMAVDYAALLRFHNPDDASEPPRDGEQGVWERLFLADEAPVIARILTTDLKRIDADFSRYLADLRRNQWSPPDDPREAPAFRLAVLLDDWHERLRTLDGAVAADLSRQLGGMIAAGLARELRALAGFPLHPEGDALGAYRAVLRPSWFAQPGTDVDDAADPGAAPVAELGEAAERFLRANFHAFRQAVALLKDGAAAALARSLESRTHSPAVGLYMAFLRLHGRIQEVINRFTDRHLDFYYRDVLGFTPRAAVADSVFLLLAQDGVAGHVAVPGGTAFTAGMDAHGREVIFTADHDALVGAARVADLRTLYFERNPLISPERDFGYATSGKSARGRLAAGAEAVAWPLLGAPKPDARPLDEEDATLGFALASPALLLREGVRDIAVAFDLELDEARPVAGARRPAKDLHDWLRRLAELTGTSVEDAFYKTFREMFRISLTTANGWLEVAEYLPRSAAIGPAKPREALTIHLRLPVAAEPVAPYDAAVHGGGYATDQPIIRFILNPTTYLYPYSLLAGLVVRRIDIEVAVKGVRDLKLYNDFGQLDANTPFHPFGPAPMLGASFIFGAGETTRKRLSDLELEVEWGGLPLARGGLAEHYEAYGKPFGEACFQARVGVLEAGRWLPAEEAEQPTRRLFAARAPAAATPRRQTLSCREVVPLARPLAAAAGEDYAYNAQTRGTFFRFTLSAPDHAFGHQDYPLLLTEVLTHNARGRGRLARPLPRAPYTPLISACALNYRASASLDLAEVGPATEAGDGVKMFHLHPFGVEALSPRGHRRVAMLPRYDAAGNLFIGLAGGDPSGHLSLFFHLRADSTPGRQARPSEPLWWYLADNRWKPLEPSRVLADGTRGFLASGIVVLDLPGDIDRGNGVMPAALHWLRVSVDRHPETLCSAYAVHAQALRASRLIDGDAAAYHGEALPAASITAARASVPGIVGVTQAAPSSGGRPRETGEQFKARVSERLRHKNRATLPWDYERLILDRFPQIHKVKCFPNLVADPDPARRLRPGHLLIVVIPHLDGESSPHLRPLADRLLLREIRERVAALASPFARIEVRNPDYEEIQVRCAVKCAGQTSGDRLRALNLAISDYLSPWRRAGHEVRFGWRIRRYDLEAFIREQPCVEYVTKFSMLRVAEQGDDRFLLDDTVSESGEQLDELGPVHPWSIAIPFRRHAIASVDEMAPALARRTGIGELEIGGNLIHS